MKIESQINENIEKHEAVPPSAELITKERNQDPDAVDEARVDQDPPSRELSPWECAKKQDWIWTTEKVSPSSECLTRESAQKNEVSKFERAPASHELLMREPHQSGKRQSSRRVKKHSGHKILRFRKSERHVHWAIAIPFMVCFASALILVFFYNPNPLRPYREVFSWIHRISGISLITIPFLAMFKSRHDHKIYFYNIRQAWVWTLEDVKWIVLKGLSMISRKIKLPDQGKFNAAEKINFMMLMSTYPLYILTGLVIWLTDGALLSWLIHFGMALMATPLLLGHLYMATIHPDTRTGLSGMTSGFVDRHWAEHHYPLWYREHYENDGRYAEIDPHIIPLKDATGDSGGHEEAIDLELSKTA